MMRPKLEGPEGMDAGGDLGMDREAIKAKLLAELMQYMSGSDLKGRYGPGEDKPKVEIQEGEDAPVEKAGVTGPAGSEQVDPDPLEILKALDEPALRALLEGGHAGTPHPSK